MNGLRGARVRNAMGTSGLRVARTAGPLYIHRPRYLASERGTENKDLGDSSLAMLG